MFKSKKMSENNNIIKVLILTIIAGVAAIGGFLFATRDSDDESDNNMNEAERDARKNSDQNENQNNIGNQNSEGVTFADGTYEAIGRYDSPAGNEEIGVSISLEEGVISSVSFDALATNARSITYQELFIEGAAGEIVGQRIENVDLSKINGSSLTPDGFNDAVDQIIEEARTQ